MVNIKIIKRGDKMNYFEYYQQFYEWGWCTITQLKRAVEPLGQITRAQYEEICGQPYNTESNPAG
jgi:uncharacterized XkdX family phage protein